MSCSYNCDFWKKLSFSILALAIWFANLAICVHYSQSFDGAAFGAFCLTAIIDFCLWLVLCD